MVDNIPVSGAHIARQSHVDAYPHLQGVKLVDLPVNEVSILIGTDLAPCFAPTEVRKAGEDAPVSFLCPFGWVLLGRAGGQTDQLAWTAFASFQNCHSGEGKEVNRWNFPKKTASSHEDTFSVKVLSEKVGGGPEKALYTSPPGNRDEANKRHEHSSNFSLFSLPSPFSLPSNLAAGTGIEPTTQIQEIAVKPDSEVATIQGPNLLRLTEEKAPPLPPDDVTTPRRNHSGKYRGFWFNCHPWS